MTTEREKHKRKRTERKDLGDKMVEIVNKFVADLILFRKYLDLQGDLPLEFSYEIAV